jgi:hypothetical protein
MIVGTAGAIAFTMAMATSAYAAPPETKLISLTCKDSTGMSWPSGGGASGGNVKSRVVSSVQQMQLNSTTMTAPQNIAANSVNTTVLQKRTTNSDTWAFKGSVNPSMNGPVPGPASLITLGYVPIQTTAPTVANGNLPTGSTLVGQAGPIAAGTTTVLAPTTGVPSASNWSVRFDVPSTGITVWCVGSQTGSAVPHFVW